MAQESGESFSQRFEALQLSSVVYALLLALFMYGSGSVPRPHIYTTFTSTLPPLILLATGLTFVMRAGEIEVCSFPRSSPSGFVFAVLFKEYNLGSALRHHQPGVGNLGRIPGSISIIIRKVHIRLSLTTLGTRVSFWAGMASESFPGASPMRCAALTRARSGDGSFQSLRFE